MWKSKELKQKFKELEKQLIEEDRRKNLLLSKELNYGYLQELLDRVDNNPNLTITVVLKSGDKLILQQKQNVNNPFNNFNGEPTEEEITVS